MRAIFTLFFILVIAGCSSRHQAVDKSDTIAILDEVLSSRLFLQDHISPKNEDTLFFVKNHFLPKPFKLGPKYFHYIYLDSNIANVRPARSFYPKDSRIRIGITKFCFEKDTAFINIKNYGAEGLYLFKLGRDEDNWKIISIAFDFGY